jgi:hypothetical protein
VRGEARDAKRSPEALSGRAIQRAVLAEALQHPATLYSFAAAAIAGTYGVFFAPFLGGAPIALAAAAGSALVSAGAFTYHYFVRGESAARSKAQRLIASEEARRRAQEQEEFGDSRDALQRGFAQVDSSEGLKALQQLDTAYDLLQAALTRHTGLDPLARARIVHSSAEAYRQGLAALSSALELLQAIQGTDRPSLEAELQELEGDIQLLKGNPAQSGRVRLKQEALASCTERLELLTRQSLDAEQLLNEADLAEAALERARFALGTLDSRISGERVHEVTTDLDRVVDQTLHAQRAVARASSDLGDDDRVRSE